MSYRVRSLGTGTHVHRLPIMRLYFSFVSSIHMSSSLALSSYSLLFVCFPVLAHDCLLPCYLLFLKTPIIFLLQAFGQAILFDWNVLLQSLLFIEFQIIIQSCMLFTSVSDFSDSLNGCCLPSSKH